ncbi:uncharacterized protein LOC118431528 [Branchiostoma floridae]|uniref:Uncharacterized protein LOC118431528 n=1 Tax=Branchiostoma floridae TaxID=7739 RepID=A0A9J7NBU2_BRAFL|nr:uncharacterized protein LOC118431528 [Branchiostoma floridae]
MNLPSCILLLVGIYSLTTPVHLTKNPHGGTSHEVTQQNHAMKEDHGARESSPVRHQPQEVVIQSDRAPSRRTRGINKRLLLGALAWHILQNSNRPPPPPPPDTTPPTLTHCPFVGDVTLPSGQTQACINIGQPTYTDDRSKAVRVIQNGNTPPGGCFPEGAYVISYIALDDAGNRNDQCQVRFSVKAIHCSSGPPKVAHGYKETCTPITPLEDVLGTTCTYRCLPGFRLENPTSQSTVCIQTGDQEAEWSGNLTCQKTNCPDAESPPHGRYSCTDGSRYQSVCRLECDVGYAPSTHKHSMVCQADEQWSTVAAICVDVKPPKFTNCPDDVIAYAERNEDHVTVTWPPLQAHDNSGDEPIVVQVDGPLNGSVLSTNGRKYRVVHTATDNQGNGNNCSFNVIPHAKRNKGEKAERRRKK